MATVRTHSENLLSFKKTNRTLTYSIAQLIEFCFGSVDCKFNFSADVYFSAF